MQKKEMDKEIAETVEEDEKTWEVTWGTFGRELRKEGFIAAPMVAVSVLQYLLQFVSIIMVGHLDQLSLSSVAIAISLTNVTGFSLLSGMAGGLETLCGQAFGAGQYHKLGTYTCTAMLSLLLVGLGSKGAAIAFSMSTWLYVILLLFYALVSSAFEKTRITFSMESLLHIRQFFRLAVPSAVMVCLKWWSCELIILLSGLLPNQKLETSVLSICLAISTLHFTVSYGFGAAASIRVSNELGANNPQAARVAVWAAMFLSVTEAIIVSTTLFFCRHVLGHAFSSEKPVVDYIAVMAPLICLSVFMDSLQAVLSGIARGSGWQSIGAYVNLGAFYLVGLPVGVVLGFPLRLRGKGLWIGIVAGSVVQSALLALITGFTNWSKQAKRARERVFVERLSEDSEAN
ncbi:unnamed protein product [Prunus armeniaca]|uniref:Multidrug and toxic compound extrusion protein n=1 Tax=Prunus armeniaca TaxID=36596 RepID=A0A6J5WRP2_PRUAR|nr:unnamed protein product [Prunus armeniaca]